MLSDRDAAESCDLLNPWDGASDPADAFYDQLVTAADAVLDGEFAFETRHPQARAWETWSPDNVRTVIDGKGRVVRVWHQVEAVEDDRVTFSDTFGDERRQVLRVDRVRLRFLAPAELESVLVAAGFSIAAQFGDWDRSPITRDSKEVITIARTTDPSTPST